jgi:peroxiredoxin
MRTSIVLPLVLLATSCKGEAPRAKSSASVASPAMAAPAPGPSPKPPERRLFETPAEKLGTAPGGFGLAVGDPAPDATLPDVTGTTRRLSDLYAERPTLVIFYRGGWCPFCNLQIHDFSAAAPDFDARGVGIVAISVDKPSEEAKTQAKHGVPFPMLSDSKLVAHRAYRVVHVTGPAEREAFMSHGLDLSAYSGESHGSYAVPAIFLVDREKTVRFVHADEDYKTRPSAREMLEVVDRVLARK